MKNQNQPVTPTDGGLHNRPLRNDGPDETPVYEDLYHDDGRRNLLEEEALGKERPQSRKGSGCG